MATQQSPSPEDHPDRCSYAPHEALPRRLQAAPRRGSWLFGAALAMVFGGTLLRTAWRDDQGGQGSVLGSNTEPSAVIPHAKPEPKAPVAQLPNEQDEDEPLPTALPFDEYVAQKALELRARGVKCGHRGRVELRVSFAPSGTSTRTELSSPRIPAKVSQCLVSRLERTAIPAFRGTEERSVQVTLALR